MDRVVVDGLDLSLCWREPSLCWREPIGLEVRGRERS